MAVKSMQLKFIESRGANAFMRRFHHSGKVVNNSNVHFGVFDAGKLIGVLSYGCPMDKNRAIRVVQGTRWGEMLELNRMAMVADAPKNSESRALSVSLRLLKKHYPHLKWIQTFADACQCGDGTIYRAANFDLIGIKKNTGMCRLKNGAVVARNTLDARSVNGRYLSAIMRERGEITPLPGFQIKYIYFLDPTYRKRLTVPILDYAEIERRDAGMYKGQKRSEHESNASAFHAEESGAIPTGALHE